MEQYKNKNTKKIRFTVSVTGIPTVNGSENIKCKIAGSLTENQKEFAIDKMFELARQIEIHQFELLERSKFYDAFGAHVFKYDSVNEMLTEIDIEEEVQKLSNSKTRTEL